MSYSADLLTALLQAEGFAIVRGVVDWATIERLKRAVHAMEPASRGRVRSPNARGLIEACPVIAAFASARAVRDLVEPLLGASAFAVRGILFDKAGGANWRVGWHQDQMIPVAEKIETPGFTAWSVKQGITHVRPPAQVLAGMLTLRVHLDDCPADNGPLKVLPGTHRLGIVPEAQVREIVAAHPPVVCTAAAGDVLLMRPLLFHASASSRAALHRRVLHLEFAAEDLPGGLQWYRP